MLATKQIMSAGTRSFVGRSTIQRVGALSAFGLTLTLTTDAAVTSSSSSSTTAVKKDRYFSTSGAAAATPAPSVTLYQYQICPFCNTAKAVLEYANVPYEAVEVNPLTKAELKWSKEYQKVPVAMLDDQQLNGSDHIVEGLLTHPHILQSLETTQWKDGTMKADDFSNSESAVQWTAFAKDDLAPLLYPNMCNTLSNSYQAFGYVDSVDSFTTTQKMAIRTIGSFAMYMAASKIKKKRNITDEKQALDDALVVLETQGLGEGKLYLSGTDQPHLGDLAVFGTLRGLEGLPVHTEVVENRQGPIPAWYQRMQSQLK